MFKKRGAIELQFNWIFVLIVGGLIMVFFSSLIQSHMETSDLETQVVVQTKLNSIMQNALLSEGSLFEVTLKDVELSRDSSDDAIYMNGNRNLRIPVDTVFSPNLIKGKRSKLLLWTLPWEMPYRITNFMYVTNPEVRYVLVRAFDSNGNGDIDDDEVNEYAEEIFNHPLYISIPDEINKELIDIKNIGGSFEPYVYDPETDTSTTPFINENNYKLRVVATQGVSLDLSSSFIGYDVSAVVVYVEDDQGGLDGWGKVEYYAGSAENQPLNSVQGDSYFLGRASLLGAIFAEDAEQFSYSMEKAYSELERITEIYMERTAMLDSYYETNMPSSPCYNSMIYGAPLNNVYGAYSYMSDMIYVVPDLDQNPENVYVIYDNAVSGLQSVKAMNHLAQLKSCPTIY